jgi:hypothetical protein
MAQSSLYSALLTGQEESRLHLAMEQLKILLAALVIRCNLALQIVSIGTRMIPMILHARVSFILPT